MFRTKYLCWTLLFFVGVYASAWSSEVAPLTPHDIVKNIPTKDTVFNALPATKAARRWLLLLDNQAFNQAWQQASVTIRQTIPQQTFVEQAKTERSPLGSPIKREIVSALTKRRLPQGPEGKYVIVQFDGNYQYRKAVKEMMVVQLDPDKHWRVAAYFLK